MAQSTSNLVLNPNPKAGLMGLTPQKRPTQQVASLAQKVGGFFANPMQHTQSQAGARQLPPVSAMSGVSIPKPPASDAPSQMPVTSRVETEPLKKASPQPLATQPTLEGFGGTMNPNFVAQTSAFNSAPQGTSQRVRGLFPDVVSSLAHLGTSVNPMTVDAYKRAQVVSGQLKQSRDNEARAMASQGLAPIPMGDITGRQAVIRQQYETQQANLAEQLAAQSALAGLGTAIQGNQVTALTGAAGAAAPQITPFGQTSFDPVTGQFAGGADGGLPPDVMQQYAQMAVSGQYSAIPSFITSNPVLNAQLNVAAKALNPSFDPVQAQGASGVMGQIPALRSAEVAAEGIKNTIVSYLAANPQLNPSDLAAGNLLQQWIQGKHLTDPKYQTLFNYLNEYTNTLAPILGVGGDPTNLKTQIAQGFINAAASGQSIAQVLDATSQLAQNKLADMQAGALGQGTTVPQGTGGGGFAEEW